MIKLTEKKKQILASMNIYDDMDIINHFPYRYETIEFLDYDKWQIDSNVIIEATIITKPKISRFKAKQSVVYFDVNNEHDNYRISIFNRVWLLKNKVGDKLVIVGKYQGNNKILALNTFNCSIDEVIGIHPVYSLKDGINNKLFNQYVNNALKDNKDTINNFLPDCILNKYGLLNRFEALNYVHNPNNQINLKRALQSLKYEEFFKYFLLMAKRNSQNHLIDSHYKKTFNINDINHFIDNLPFKLTDDQLKAINDILSDLSSEKQMCRLLQGDVGTGKSIVAFTSMFATVLSGKQAAIMAPTEILAKQHYDNLINLFKDYDIKIGLLFSDLDKDDKYKLKQKIENNEINIIVGTHALFQQDVSFYNLGLIITDEQHRFGVNQRKSLLMKGNYADVLLMSATPIPRTLVSTIYGDMDISTIYQSPNPNKKIITTLIKQNSFISKIDEIDSLLAQGNQMYVICPMIEDNNSSRNVLDIYNNLSKHYQTRFKVGLLHGQMDSKEKLFVQQQFFNKQIDILVSTTVVEVGVDVIDGNIMVIYDANRFGLAQLHQLRGRIGRSGRNGYCYLLTSSQDQQAIDKLNIIVENTDGFKISYYDLLNRGPGDMLGTRQSGLPVFNIGNVINDNKILIAAKKDADEIYKDIDKYPVLNDYIVQENGDMADKII